MNNILIFSFLLLMGVFVLSGCQGIDLSKVSDADMARISEKAVVCNEPYIRVGVECCLDQNSNNICDKDETNNNNNNNNRITEQKTDSNPKPEVIISSSLPSEITPSTSNPIIVSLVANPTRGRVPLTIQFTSVATGAAHLTYAWDFNGDGVSDSNQQNPTYTFTTPNDYFVKVTITNANGDFVIKDVPIVATQFDSNLDLTSYFPNQLTLGEKQVTLIVNNDGTEPLNNVAAKIVGSGIQYLTSTTIPTLNAGDQGLIIVKINVLQSGTLTATAKILDKNFPLGLTISPEASETIITQYSKVNLELINANVDWEKTWGKIVSVSYRINNNEAGTIQPERLVMKMEGYEDLEKNIVFPISAKNIKAGVSVELTSPVSNGFAYSPKIVGDLSSVDITLVLYDASGKKITSTTKTIDINTELADLSNYPNYFVTNGRFNGFFVVGEKAAAIDNLAMTDIIAGMKYVNENGERVSVTVSHATKLDSEIIDINAQNLIVVGNPCSNTISQRLLGLPESCGIGPACDMNQCLTGFAPGKARIKLFERSNGNIALLVAGYSGADTRLAASVLAHRWTELYGTEVEIEGSTSSDATITFPTSPSNN